MTSRMPTTVVVAAVALGVAVAYYAVRGGRDAAAPSQATQRSAAVVTPPGADRPATPAPGPEIAAAPEATRTPAPTDAQIRAATIPLERALAGLEEVELRMQLPPNEGFRVTLLRFVAEPDDPAWGPATEAHILGQIAQATGLRANRVDVDCRTTLCRVLLTRPTSTPDARYNGFHELAASFGLETTYVLAMPDETGTPINLAYLRRREP